MNGTLSTQFLERFFMPSSSYKSKQMIVIRRDLKMRKGKIAAQASHACVEAKIVIQDGEVKVNGVVETQRGKKLFGGEVVEYNGSSILIKK